MSKTRIPVAKPVLKWAGGKRELIPSIREYYKNLNPGNYVEPFFGGGAVYFDILKTFGSQLSDTSIINDINTDLVCMYRDIKSSPDEIIYQCKKIENDYYKHDYYYIRDRYNGITRDKKKVEKYEGVKRSAALILLNRTCFNGIYRVNKKGLFNVPKGDFKNRSIIDEDNLYRLSLLLPKIENIRNVEFDEITDINKGDLVYLDPPYHPITKTSFTSYSGSFGEKEQVRLRNYFDKLNKMGVNVILSNSACPFIKDLYSNYDIVKVYCKRTLNSRADRRGEIPEYLVLGELCSNS